MSSMVGKEGDCAGCTTIWHIRLGKQCLCSLISDCPCLHCLVKVICTDQCKDLNKHIGKSKLWLIRNDT